MDLKREVEEVVAQMEGDAYEEVRERARALLQQPLDEADRYRVQWVVVQLDTRLYEPDLPLARSLVDGARDADQRREALVALGNSLFSAGRIPEAEQTLNEAARMAQEAGDHPRLWRARVTQGMLAMRRREVARAEGLLRDAAEGFHQVGELRMAGAAWVCLANLWVGEARREEAAEAFARAEACAVGYPRFYAEILRTRARLSRLEGDLPGARTLLERALELLKGRRTMTMARTLNDLGDLARLEGRPEAARALFRESLEIRAGRDDAVTRLNLALLELQAGGRAEIRAVLKPIFEEAHRRWYTANAHGVAVGAADDLQELDLHLDAVEGEVADVSAEPDLLQLFREATQRWAPTHLHRAARLGMLYHRQACLLQQGEDEAGRILRDLRGRGASIPLGPLALHELAGRGGMGQVWRGTVWRSEVEVAVKILAEGPAHRLQERQTALARELRAVARLDHPHIVPLVDHGVVPAGVHQMTDGQLPEGVAWLATRWAPGGTLVDGCGRTPYRRIREALVQLLQALAAAHAQGILHLDVKPANILVAQDEPLVTWLTDFGVARALTADAEQPVAGTPAFMAPEQCTGATRSFGPWTDLYAVGATAVALAQGTPPFSGSSAEILRYQVTRPVPPLVPRVAVPEGFEDWIRILLAKEPEHRFRWAADAAAALLDLGDAPDSFIAPLPQAPAPLSSSSTFLLDAIPLSAVADETSTPPVPPRPPMPVHAPSPPPRQALPPALAMAASRLVPLRPIPLVGHVQERQALWDALGRAEHGVQVARVPSGAGGRRLLRWLADAARRTAAARVLWLDGAGHDPWAALLRDLLQVRGLPVDALERSLPGLLDTHLGPNTLGPTERALLVQVLAERQEADAAPLDPLPMVVRVVTALAPHRPVLLCVDSDDPGVASVVQHLLSYFPDHPVLVAAQTEVALPDLPPERLHEVRLAPLPPARIRELLDGLVPLAPDLRERLVDAAGGWPEVAVWTVRGWLADRRLQVSPEGLCLTGDWPVPRSPEAALQALIEPVVTVRVGHRRRLELAALRGDRVDRAMWRRACEADGLAWDPGLEEALVARGLIQEERGGFTFTDHRLRAGLLAELTPQARRKRHLVWAQVVEEEGERGMHLLEGGEPVAALEPLRRALLRSIHRALRRSRELWTVWQRARLASGLPDEAPEVLRGEVLHWMFERPNAGALPGIDARIERARGLGDPDVEAMAWTARGVACWGLHRREEALVAMRRAASLGRGARIRRLALRSLGRAQVALGDLVEARASLTEAVALGDGMARCWLAGLLRELGDFEAAYRYAEATPPAEETFGYREAIQRLNLCASLAAHLGHPAIAARRRAEAETLGRATSTWGAVVAMVEGIMWGTRQGLHDQVEAQADGLPPFFPMCRLVRDLLAPGPATPDRLAEVTRLARTHAWSLDAGDVAELLDYAAERPRWSVHRGLLRSLAEDVRSRRPRRRAGGG